MEWISNNWPLIVLAVLFIAMFILSHWIRRKYRWQNNISGQEVKKDESISVTKTENNGHGCCH